MFVKKIKSNKGTIEVRKFGIERIFINDDGTADVYTAGRNIFNVKCKKILNDNNKTVSNSKKYHKNLF
jgi:hypothetical protein